MYKSLLLKRLNTFIHVLTLLIIMNVGLPLWRIMSGYSLDVLEGDSLQRNLLLAGYILTLFPLLFNLNKVISTFLSLPTISIIMLLVTLSVFVSYHQELTLRRIIAFYLTALFSISLYLQYSEVSFFVNETIGYRFYNHIGIKFDIGYFCSLLGNNDGSP